MNLGCHGQARARERLGLQPALHEVVERNGRARALRVERRLPVRDAELVHQQTEKRARLVGQTIRKVALVDAARLVLPRTGG